MIIDLPSEFFREKETRSSRHGWVFPGREAEVGMERSEDLTSRLCNTTCVRVSNTLDFLPHGK